MTEEMSFQVSLEHFQGFSIPDGVHFLFKATQWHQNANMNFALHSRNEIIHFNPHFVDKTSNYLQFCKQ